MGWSYARPPGWKQTRKRILLRDPWCRICRRAASVEVDHVINVRAGGWHGDENLAGLCLECHREKTKRETDRAKASMPKAKRKPERHPGLL